MHGDEKAIRMANCIVEELGVQAKRVSGSPAHGVKAVSRPVIQWDIIRAGKILHGLNILFVESPHKPTMFPMTALSYERMWGWRWPSWWLSVKSVAVHPLRQNLLVC